MPQAKAAANFFCREPTDFKAIVTFGRISFGIRLHNHGPRIWLSMMQYNQAIEELSKAHGPARQALLEKQISALEDDTLDNDEVRTGEQCKTT